MIGDGTLTKFKFIQAFIVDLLICKNEEDQFKIEALEWSQQISHYKPVGIFPDAQGQLTPQSKVRSVQASFSLHKGLGQY